MKIIDQVNDNNINYEFTLQSPRAFIEQIIFF